MQDFSSCRSHLQSQIGYWSMSVILEPYCVFSPSNPSEVTQAKSVLRSSQTPFAVRGGDHNIVKGAASIDYGVLIVFTKFKDISLSSDQKTVSIGPDLTWIGVYDWLAPYQLAVVGGRYPTVGVSGFLFGGGISFYGGQYGWGANNVRNYQVITTDGQIIDVNTILNADLSWALKGRSSNFGIVTRFDLETHPGPDVFAGTLTHGPETATQAFVALETFAVEENGINDPCTAVLPNFFIDPASGSMNAVIFVFNNANSTRSFKRFIDIKPINITVAERKFNDVVAESISSGDRSSR